VIRLSSSLLILLFYLLICSDFEGKDWPFYHEGPVSIGQFDFHALLKEEGSKQWLHVSDSKLIVLNEYFCMIECNLGIIKMYSIIWMYFLYPKITKNNIIRADRNIGKHIS